MMKRALSITNSVCTLLFITGCQSTQPENTTTTYAKITIEEYQQMQEAVAQWQDSKVAIARLLDSEKDLQRLIKALSEYVSNAETTQPMIEKSSTTQIARAEEPPVVVEQVTTQNNYEPSVVTKQSRSQQVSDPGSVVTVNKSYKYSVQLASLNGKTQVLQMTSTLHQTLPDLIENKEAFSIESFDGNGSTQYRVKWGAFNSRDDALNACDRFKQRKHPCFVTAFGGKKLSNL